MKIYHSTILLLFILSTTIPAQIYLDSTAAIEDRVNDLLPRMTLQEKIGQMIQVDRGYVASNKSDITIYGIGSLLSGGGSGPTQNNPTAWADMYDDFQSYALANRLMIPLIYGIDAVHGNNNVYGSTIFPHNIGMGSTHDENLVRMADSIVAIEVAATGIDWTFAPCIAVPRNERWGRTYEGFGETSELNEIMSRASVLGFSGNDLSNYNNILACAKHFVADGGTENGTNEGNAIITETELRAIHLPGYIEAINQGVGSIMASYSSWNGLKMHGNHYLMTDVLKGELGFTGFIVSDWAGIDQLPGDFREDVKQSINAGIDMVMLPDRYQLFATTLTSLVQNSEVSTDRIDDAVKRILRKKFELGLFERPFANRSLLPKVGSAEHRNIARECVRKSLVLLKKKDGILPLNKSGENILVAGKSGNDIGNQCGGWTISWQGSSGSITPGTTIYNAIQNVVGSNNVFYDRYADSTSGFDVAVVVIGETPYAEGSGDRSDLSLEAEDLMVVRKVKEAGLKTIVILLSGRPMIINSIIPYSDAIIAAWLPGTEGDGIADILFGDYQPSGTLSHTWPRAMDQIPINFGDTNYDPLFPLNFGITSLDDSQFGSPPQYYSSSSTLDGNSIIISFNKAMNSPVGFESDFILKINNINIPIITSSLSSNDIKDIVLNFTPSINNGDEILVQYTGTGLTSQDGGSLEPFGPEEVYNLSNQNNISTIPGKIEAENFFDMYGVQTENTSDVGGGLNVGWIDTGDWMDYNVVISDSGSYNLTYRVASLSASGKITLKSDGQTINSVDLPITGGWQNWQSVSSVVYLFGGQHTIRLDATRGGFNINWFNFDALTNIETTENIPKDFSLSQNYPNPFNPSTCIQYSIGSKEFVTLKVFDVLGNEVATLVNENREAGIYSIEINADILSSGVYYYKIQAGAFIQTKKMILIK